MITYVNSFGRFTMQINGNCEGGAYGFTETYDGPVLTSNADILQLGNDLAKHRANLLVTDHKIVNVRYSEVGPGIKFKTAKALTAKEQGKYPPAAIADALDGQDTTLAASGAGATAVAAVFTFQSQTELFVDDGDTVVRFRFNGEGFSYVTRGFHGCPDFFCNDRQARLSNAAGVWSGVTPYVAGTITAVKNNFYDNFEPFLTLVKSKFKLVRKPGARGVPAGGEGDASKFFALCPIESITFEDISKSPIGRPFGLSVGRQTTRS